MNSSAPATAIIQPYLTFGGRCDEALAFYQTAIGAEVEMLMRFNESTQPVPAEMMDPGFERKVMHCSFRIGSSVLMASDGCGESSGFSGFSLSLTFPDEAACDKAFAALADGGKITMPLAKTFWSPRFGMVEDRFGVSWMVGLMH